eukprot:TRINITY_DN8843_c0_g1_i1.p1 TRINITY_DN8843_c0_g1~~TRINITY_DN8843_c0_g1_i1.p1  ORF type:complete len:103 (+),score=24.21 TRINITY_DN8843_c0_g1_i1:59-367(+)
MAAAPAGLHLASQSFRASLAGAALFTLASCANLAGSGSTSTFALAPWAISSFPGGPVEIDENVVALKKKEEAPRHFMVINELGIYEDYEHFMRDGSVWWQTK